MLKTLLLACFLLIQVSLTSTDPIPLLDERKKDNTVTWSLNQQAEEILTQPQFVNRPLHVVAVGGPTRAGKSFIMSKMLEKFTSNGGQIHFGTFVHKLTMVSVTKGMDIALVEYQDQLILLLDCEGLDSVTKDMDPRLMVTMAMIAQKMIYLNNKFDVHTIENISTMISNRNNALDTTGVPLDTMYFILNQCALERKENFLQENMKNNPEYFNYMQIINAAFPVSKQKTFFVTKLTKSKKSVGPFEEDIETIFQNVSTNIDPFCLNGTEFTIGHFVDFLKTVLENINTNKKISFPNVLQATYEQFARNKYCELSGDMRQCTEWQNDDKLKNRLLEIEAKEDEFANYCKSYKSQICDLYDAFMNDFKKYRLEFEAANEAIGNEVEKTEVVTRKDKLGREVQILQPEENGFVGGLSSGTKVGGCTGNIVGAGIGAFVGGIGGAIFGGQKEVKIEKIKFAVFQITTITYKNGKNKVIEEKTGECEEQNEI